jgi:hypothetical protein
MSARLNMARNGRVSGHMTTLSRFLHVRAPASARAVAAFTLISVVIATAGRASERWATLEAIHQLENPTNSQSPGTYGELGAYQFLETTWRMHTTAPFRRALDRKSSDAVAVKHYEWIKAELEHHGIVATPYRIALAWNGGIKAVMDGSPPATAEDYASRAANIAAELEKGELADVR